MSAPALILLAPGSHDSRAEQIYHRLCHDMARTRRALSVHLAFTACTMPTPAQILNTLDDGCDEAVFVPMDLTRVANHSDQVLAVLRSVRHQFPTTAATLSSPIGPAIELLNILDVRLRDALSASRATELDALVLSVPNSGDTRGMALLSRRARQWAAHHKLPVQLAFGDNCEASVAGAIAAFHDSGRHNVAVGSLYLVPDDDYLRQAEIALAHGAIAVSAPLGVDSRICDVIMARYAFAAMDLLDAHDAQELSQAQ